MGGVSLGPVLVQDGELDIGALPDRSVAETLQRIPGITIGRFEKTTDPDRFSVEGTGVIVRGLPFVRSELNGREIFSATGGRVLASTTSRQSFSVGSKYLRTPRLIWSKAELRVP